MALVDNHQAHCREHTRSRFAAVRPDCDRLKARIILDAGARARGLDHFEIKGSALVETLCLEATVAASNSKVSVSAVPDEYR